MSGLRMTPARLELLRAVERGEVFHRPGFARTEAYDVLTDPRRPDLTVTGSLRLLAAERLVGRRPDLLRSTKWELTDAGRAVLAEAGEQS